MEPQDEVARDFMTVRGYAVEPVTCSKVEGGSCWYYYYELPEGYVELEVEWTSERGWTVETSGFRPYEASGGSDDER